MANIGDIYTELDRLGKLAESVTDNNWTAAADLEEQAVRLEEIAAIAGRNAVLLNDLDTVLVREG